MDRLRIRGGRPLRGTVRVGGSKNESLPCMAASLLVGELSLANVPEVRDVATMSRLLRTLGVSASQERDGCVLHRDESQSHVADYDLVRQMRASVCVLGPLLASRGQARVAMPGGCQIGHRPVDVHLRGLSALGADVRLDRGDIVATASRLRGAEVDLAGPRGSSVTGTCNVLAAATAAEGTTVLRNAAVEPEVVRYGRLLQAMGADITGIGTPEIRVTGPAELAGTRHRISGDRIELVTLAAAAAATGGEVTIEGVPPGDADAAAEWLRATGVSIEETDGAWRVAAPAGGVSQSIETAPHPGLPTDVQAQLTAWLTQCRGSASVRDAVFPERFGHLAELARLGADVTRTAEGAVVRGRTDLVGTGVLASDLRASAALVIAGLAAAGETTVRRVYHLDRGYERLDRKLHSLGADVVREPDPMPF